MAILLIQAWGGKDWMGPLYPSPRAPEWAVTAAKRMEAMDINLNRINEILREMRKERLQLTYRIGDREYDVVVE